MIKKIEERKAYKHKEQDGQPQVDVERLRQNRAAETGNGRNRRKDARIGRAVNEGPCQETEQTGNQIVEIALAAAGGAGARSETGARHADAKDQAADQIADHVGGRDGGQCDQAERIQTKHSDH